MISIVEHLKSKVDIEKKWSKAGVGVQLSLILYILGAKAPLGLTHVTMAVCHTKKVSNCNKCTILSEIVRVSLR